MHDGQRGAGMLDRLEQEGLSVIVLRGRRELYRSSLPGVRPLIEMVDRFPGGLDGSEVADKVVGGCAALVFGHLRVARVLAVTSSIRAHAILKAANIPMEAKSLVPEIHDRAGTDVCPFERLSRVHTDPARLIEAIRTRLSGPKSSGLAAEG